MSGPGRLSNAMRAAISNYGISTAWWFSQLESGGEKDFSRSLFSPSFSPIARNDYDDG